jgi:hypothetical protein
LSLLRDGDPVEGGRHVRHLEDDVQRMVEL